MLHYGTFKHISAVRDIPIQTLSYRYCRVLNRLEEAIDDAGLNTASNRRLSVLEAKLADTERLLELSRQKCANLNEQLKDARKYALPDLPNNLRERLNIKLSDLSLDSSTRNFLAAHYLLRILGVTKLKIFV